MVLAAVAVIDTLNAAEVRALIDQLQSRLNAAKIAYLNSTTLDGEPVTYDVVADAAKTLIKASYRLQVLEFGKVRMKLTVAKLIRRGR